MVVGQDQKHLGLLVVPSITGFVGAGINTDTIASLKSRPEAHEMLRLEIRRLVGEANGFKPFERIANFTMIEKPFEVGDELTMTFKLRRHVITEKYATSIEGMFNA
jgi:long-chain acyl-CoA synthetase